MLTIWSLIDFPSCSTVRIFYRKNERDEQTRPPKKINCEKTYKIDSNSAYVTFYIRIILQKHGQLSHEIYSQQEQKQTRVLD